MNTYDDVLGAAQGLPPIERLRLVEAIWATVPPEQWPPPDKELVEEAQRRSKEFDAGRMTASPWPEARNSARRKAGLDE